MRIKSSAPGRICLFGEHQDYMGLPVIAGAIDLKINIEGNVSEGDRIELNLLDLNKKLEFSSKKIKYTIKRDYLKSAIRVLKKKHLFKPKSIDAFVKGNIPIQAGTSSSSALVVAWVGFLLAACSDFRNHLNDLNQIAELSYLAEVEEFKEKGGRMDHYVSALGGIVYIDFYRGVKTFKLPVNMKEFVLGDSLQAKPTIKTLKRIRQGQEQGFKELSKLIKFKDNFHVMYEKAKPYLNKISSDIRPYIKAVLMNHKITDEAKCELLKESPKLEKVCDLMNEHHKILRDDLKISTQKIEKMIEKSLKAGALCAKINGSGEGGCMFAFCPGRQEQVAEAIKNAGARAYLINIGKGVEVKVFKNGNKKD